MAYKQIQFIGLNFEITMRGVAGGDTWCTMEGNKYSGKVNDAVDVQKKCRKLFRAIQAAYDDGAINRSSSVMKLFMAPEFFFRGRWGAYSIETLATIIPTMDTEGVQHPKFDDWVFVYGTAIGHQTLVEREEVGGMSVTPAEEEIFNVALVRRGGNNGNAPDGSLLVYKEYISAIDFLRLNKDRATWDDPTKRLAEIEGHAALLKPTLGSRDKGASTAAKNLREYNPTQKGLGGGSIFVCGGVRFALETCLDHLKGRVKQSVDADRDSKVQVQLIPSAGASIKDEHIVTVRSGLIFNVDALAPRVALKKRRDAPLNSAKGANNSTVVASSSSTDVGNGFPGASVVAYPPQDIPYAWSLRLQGLFT